MQRMTGLDAGFLHIESSRVFAYLGSAVLLDPSTAPGGAVDLESLRTVVATRLHLLPVLRKRIVEVPLGIGLPYWIDDPDFDLDFHLRESAIPAPGSPRQLAEMVARTFSRPLDRSRPLWELWLVHGLADGGVVLLTKFHHALVDGVSGNEVLATLLDSTAEGRTVDAPARTFSGERLPSDLELLGRGVTGIVGDAMRALRQAPRTLPLLPTIPGAPVLPGVALLHRTLARLRGTGDDERERGMLEVSTARAPRTPFNGPVSAHRRWAYGTVSLDRLKAVKNAAGVTINDLVVALCSGALRRWLTERDALPDEPLVAAIPISVRTEESDGSQGNRIGMMTAPIATHEPDPRSRLTRVSTALRGAKELHGALPAATLTDVTAFVPPAVSALATRTALGALSRTRPPVNLLISNVPGPREPLYCAGAQMQGYFPVPPIMDGVGLNFTMVSYRDELGIGVVTDRDQVDDPWPLLDLFDGALAELEQVFMLDTPRGPAPTTPGE